jgi:hypothetical protein
MSKSNDPKKPVKDDKKKDMPWDKPKRKDKKK